MKSQTFVSATGRLLFWKFIEGTPKTIKVDGVKFVRGRDKYGTVYIREEPDRDYTESFDAETEEEALDMATQAALERIGYRVEGAMELEEEEDAEEGDRT